MFQFLQPSVPIFESSHPKHGGRDPNEILCMCKEPSGVREELTYFSNCSSLCKVESGQVPQEVFQWVQGDVMGWGAPNCQHTCGTQKHLQTKPNYDLPQYKTDLKADWPSRRRLVGRSFSPQSSPERDCWWRLRKSHRRNFAGGKDENGIAESSNQDLAEGHKGRSRTSELRQTNWTR